MNSRSEQMVANHPGLSRRGRRRYCLSERRYDDLKNTTNEEKRDKRVKVNVHRVEPFHKLFGTVGTLISHIVIHHIPQKSSEDHSSYQNDKRPLHYAGSKVEGENRRHIMKVG